MSVITLTRVHLDVLEEHVPELLLNPFQSLLNNFFKKKDITTILQKDMYLEKNLKANFEFPMGGC